MMKDILDWGIEVVLWFQQFSPTLDIPFKIFSFFGDEGFFLLFFPIFYWCIDKKNGFRLSLFFLVSAYINFIAKGAFAQPRPFQYDSSVKALVHASGGGIPSGHTQGWVVLWGFLVSKYKMKWLMALATLMIIMVPMSRIYLGAHFPTDLFAGYVLGAVLLLAYLQFEFKIETILTNTSLWGKMTMAAALPLLFFLLSDGSKEMVSVSSAFWGLSIGYVLENEWVNFSSTGSWWQKILRFVAGAIVGGVIYVGAKSAFESLEPAIFFRIIRYFLLGAWSGLGAPWLFVKLKLAPSDV